MQKINYQKQLDKIIYKLGDKVPSLLLHSCCAPCSSYCVEYLSQYFNITIFYYNPNIYPETEYEKRKTEQKRLISEMKTKYPVKMLDCDFESDKFYEMAKGMENCREGGERCFNCYRLRLRKTAVEAKENNFDYFTTTLTISPLKNARKINEIGNELSEQYGVAWLPSDFKKREGYKRSIELSKAFNLYRQNYCGCVFSQSNKE
ncbi:MAG: epoxyqueuosine reductase QueH [Clostridia bacterium]|nr:epoxyqueuosine reductase QueH [Clostridia bacterium]